MQYAKKLLFVLGVGLGMLCGITACSKSDGNSPAASSPTANISGAADKSSVAAIKENALTKANSDASHPEVLLDTSFGKITITLDAEKTQQTVHNFLSYVNDGHYSDTIVHQVYPGVSVVAGGYGKDLVERPTHLMSVRNEAEKGSKNLRGTVAMVRFPDNADSATSQFFFNVCDNPSLDFRDTTPEGYGYCVFGTVTDGMDVVDKIAQSKVHDTSVFESAPEEPILIKSAKQIR
jgi:cyclophilin family peptidyl-prolyl cis-trans isomerase